MRAYRGGKRARSGPANSALPKINCVFNLHKKIWFHWLTQALWKPFWDLVKDSVAKQIQVWARIAKDERRKGKGEKGGREQREGGVWRECIILKLIPAGSKAASFPHLPFSSLTSSSFVFSLHSRGHWRAGSPWLSISAALKNFYLLLVTSHLCEATDVWRTFKGYRLHRSPQGLLLTLTVNRGHFPGQSYGGKQSKGPFDKK